MNSEKKELIERAKALHGEIYPCGDKKTLYDCFTIHNGKLCFWFNIKTNTTKVLF